MVETTESTGVSEACSEIRVGPAGWAYDDWKGVVYPPSGLGSVHPLTYLSGFFDTVEVNSSFYRPAAAKHTAAWVERVAANRRFRFTAKLWRGFTHMRDAWPEPDAVARVLEGFKPLAAADRLGAVVAQFPWSFKRTRENRAWLARLADVFSGLPLAVELRHASWDTPRVVDEFCRRGLAFCSIDQPLFDGSLEPTEHVTAPLAYVRLHGRNRKDWFREDAHRDDRYDYLYSEDEVGSWVERINRMARSARQVYVITNNHFEGQAAVNAFELQSALTNKCAVPPGSLRTRYPGRMGPCIENS